MQFREERKHYLDGVFVRLVLHGLVHVLCFGSIYLALVLSSWLPILLSLALAFVLEAACLYDRLRGWPMSSAARKSP